MSKLSDNSCQHPTQKSRYLTTYEQTHLDDPDTKVMLACLFLCEDCGKIYAAHVEAIRGPSKDGSIPSALSELIKKRKENIELEIRAHKIANQLIKDQETKP
jgi:hypothetical protein